VPAVNVRYIVDDVASAIDFYTNHLGFEVEMHPGPSFAALRSDGFTLYLNARWSRRGQPADARRSSPRARWLEPDPN
jgi:catechol 2,3-dioxygenase-like lactoylglutathione lyase family enzyme